MDTISRENNSYLPVAAVIVGLLALVLSGVALAKISSTKKEISETNAQLAQIETLSSRINEVEGAARNASNSADRAMSTVNKLAGETNAAFGEVANRLGTMQGELTKVQETRVAPKAPANGTKTPSGPAVAGPDEYVVKGGDTGYKIATSNGVSLADLQAVNPGVSWTGLKVGQKIKLPAKK